MGSAAQSLSEIPKYETRPGLLCDPADVWRVCGGALDLFLVRIEAGEPAGVRRPITRVEPGESILCPAPDDGFALWGQPAPGCRLERIDWQALSEDDLERWMSRLASVLSGVAPASFVNLASGQQMDVRDGTAILSPRGVAWVELTAGTLQFLGRQAVEPIVAPAWMPISPSVWLVAESGARVRRIDPDGEQAAGAIELFHRHITAALAEHFRRQDADFTSRLAERARAHQANMQTAHRALAAVLQRKKTAAVMGGGDPLLMAAQEAGGALGIKIVAPAVIRGARSRDPIENIARASGVRIRRVSLGPHWWRHDGGPMVAYWADSGSPVALLPRGPGRYEIFDPVQRQRRRVTTADAAGLGPWAHCFYRSFPNEKLSFASLVQFGVRGMERDAAVILMAGLLAGLLGLVTPVVSGILFDTVIPSTDRPQLIQIFIILTAAALSTWLLGLVQSFALLRVEGRMDAALQSALWDRLLKLPVTFYRGFSAGDLAMRSLSISSIREVLTGNALSAILSGIFSIFSVGLLFHYGAGLAVPACGLIFLSFLVTVSTALLQVRIQRKFAALAGRVAGLLPQLLSGIAKIRVAAAEDRAFARWAVGFAEQKRLAVSSRRISVAMSMFFPLFQAVTMMVLFALLARPGESGKPGLTTGAFLAFQAAFFQVLGGASRLGSALISVLSIVPLYERARPILEALPEVSGNQSDPGEITGDVEMTHIAFRYRPDLPAVLKDVSLRIRAGQFVAIVGGTGSGKSSIFRLLLGFEKPESGSIFYDGQDLAGLDTQALRRQIGVVLQQTGVLGGDIFSNIVGSAALTLDHAWEAARMAGLDEDIRNMPMGMHTVLPEGGLGLSGGQRQRLQIARAVVHRPRLILFDEATSALDNQTQAVVMESLSQLKATRIVIAHRLSSIRHADCIFVLNQGVIEESGTFDELMARQGFFARLASRQLT